MKRVSAIVSSFIVVSLVLSLGLVACNDDNPTSANGPVGDEGLATSIVTDVVIPLVQTLALAEIVQFLPPPGSPLPTPNQPECTTLPFCEGGSAQSCLGETGYVISFADCNLNGMVIAGSITLVPVNETSGGATVDITIDGDELVGSVTWGTSGEGACFFQQFEAMTYSSSSVAATFSGAMEYCDPPVVVNDVVVPTGAEFTFDLNAVNRKVGVSIFSFPESGAEVSVIVWDSEGNFLLACDGPLFGSLECNTEGEDY